MRKHLQQHLNDLNPVVDREGASGAIIGLDISDEEAASDVAAGDYALGRLNATLPPDYEATVLDVSLDSTVASDPEPVGELEAAPREGRPPVFDVEAVPLDGDEGRP